MPCSTGAALTVVTHKEKVCEMHDDIPGDEATSSDEHSLLLCRDTMAVSESWSMIIMVGSMGGRQAGRQARH